MLDPAHLATACHLIVTYLFDIGLDLILLTGRNPIILSFASHGAGS